MHGSSLIASKASSTTKIKSLSLHTPSAISTPAIGEIALEFLDDDLLLANGRSLQNGASGGGGMNGNNSSAPQKLSSSNPKRASGGSGSSKRPPGSANKNGQVASFHERFKAMNRYDISSSSLDDDDDDDDQDYDGGSGGDGSSDEDYRERGGGNGIGIGAGSTAGSGRGASHSSSQPAHPLVLRLKKSSGFSGHSSDSLDTDFIGKGEISSPSTERKREGKGPTPKRRKD